MKKQLLLAALLLGSFGVFAQTGMWVSQATNFTPVSSGVRNVICADTNTVWIAAYDGSGGGANRQDCSHTSDGGATWTATTVTGVPTSHDWSMVFGTDADHAWAVFYNATAGSGGGIWATTDGGATWNQQGVGTIFDANSFPDVVHFWDNNNGWTMGDPNPKFEMYTTSDGGATWTAVNAANIPANLSGEYGIVAHYQVIGDTIWFDTNKGRVFRSPDRGQTWTVSSTGLTVPTNGAIDICFNSATHGVARLYTATSGVSTMKETNDGGDTWTNATPTGNLWGSDLKYVPGTASMMVSTGADATNGFIGSSYSLDGGLTWNDIDIGVQQYTALGIADSLTMWAGGFTSSPSTDGIFKWTIVPTITCSDANINPGTATANATSLCEGDTLTVTATGVYAPTEGQFYGVSWIISAADISGDPDPLNNANLVATYTFTQPAPATSSRILINDATLIDGVNVPYGTYYWTPVVFANATGTAPTFLSDLTLDPNCTYTGTSIPVVVYAPGDPNCPTGVSELIASQFNLTASQIDANTLDIRINAAKSSKTTVKVYDLAGRVLATSTYSVDKGLNHYSLDASTLSAGTYVIKAEIEGSNIQTKVIKY